jgi:hypothetical protein
VLAAAVASPVSSNQHTVLYQTATDWQLYDVNGAHLFTHVPAPVVAEGGHTLAVHPERTISVGPLCSLLLSASDVGGQPMTTLDVLDRDEQGNAVIERVDALPVPQESVRVTAQLGGAFTWTKGSMLRAYACLSRQSYAWQPDLPLLTILEYPTIPAHRPTPPPEGAGP